MIFTIVFPMMVFAADPPPFGGGGDDVNDAPIDGGLSLLVAAGVGYTLKRVNKKNGKNDEPQPPLPL